MENRRKRWYDLFGFIPRNLSRILLWLSIIPISLIVVLLIYVWRANQFPMSEISAPPESCSAYDRNGKWMGTLSDHDRVYVSRDELPDALVYAFIAREDEDFFSHGGIVYSSMIRSVLRNISTMSYAQGGSTITMQLARNCYELGGRTLDRKLLEVAVARRIERKYSKDDILTTYLNRIYYGQQCYGIAQAAELYFGKAVRDLNLGECAVLAGLVRGPSIYNPITNATAALKVRNETLVRMKECGFITEDQFRIVSAEPLTVRKQKKENPSSYPILAVSRDLSATCSGNEQQEETSGIFVLTSFDLDMQRMLEEISEPIISTMEHTPEWRGLPKRVDNNLDGCVQSAILCVDSRNGEILALTGGRSAADGLNRWDKRIRPGFLFAPVVNLCAVDQRRSVIRHDPEMTGRGVGFNSVIEMAVKAGYLGDLPRAQELYTGNFEASLSEVVNALFMMANRGLDIPLSSIRQVGTSKKNLLAASNTLSGNPVRELLPRESTRLVMTLPPFRYDDTKRRQVIDSVLPEYGGNFSAVLGKYYTVYVWLGFDRPEETVYKKKNIPAVLKKTCAALADEVYTRMEQNRRKPAAKPEQEKADEEQKSVPFQS